MGDPGRGLAEACMLVGAIVIGLASVALAIGLWMIAWEWLTEQIWLAGDRIKQRRRAKGEPHD
jgi:hypothetical protein